MCTADFTENKVFGNNGWMHCEDDTSNTRNSLHFGTYHSRSSATTRGGPTFKIQKLPLLRRDMPLKKEQVFELELCTITYDFDDQAANKRYVLRQCVTIGSGSLAWPIL
jgi:hypothetical protein